MSAPGDPAPLSAGLGARAAQVELIRKRYRYRDLILHGRVSVPRAAAVRLVGPDCACHLHRQWSRGSEQAPGHP